jgi:predicted phage gp36 major capsid-like protein
MIPLEALALSSAAEEFMRITEQIEPMQCQKRQLRRQIVMAEAEKRDADARKLREDFSKLDRDPRTAKLERRLAELEKSITQDDLPAINRQHVEGFYRCE